MQSILRVATGWVFRGLEIGGSRFSGPIQPVSKGHTAFCTRLLDLFPEHGPNHHNVVPGSSVRPIDLHPLCSSLARNGAALTAYVGPAKYK